jgi:hypothetical protein
MKLLSVVAVLVMSTLFVACGDKGGSNSNNNNNVNGTTPLAQYYYINKGLCYDDRDARVDVNNCSGLKGYYDVNGYCYSPSNVRVDNSLCRTYPMRVRPNCQGNDYYTMRGGQRRGMECNNRGCSGRNVYGRDGRGYYCR